MSSRKQEGGAGASKATRMTKHTLRQTGPRGEHRGRSSGSGSRRRSGSKSNAS
jgi:hypothetical protein